jgi:2,4-dienoyl-CoA reductase-like NADH-dependent reductase (Old Yellow Enzyme family)
VEGTITLKLHSDKETKVSLLFTPAKIGNLDLPNRLVRSATAESMADEDGRPRPQLANMYRNLALGGVGLIITGHMYVHPSGKCHPEMTGIYSDELIPDLAKLVEVVHAQGGKIVVQINHGGMQCSIESVDEAIAPSAIDKPVSRCFARQMSQDEIYTLIDAYAQAARRAKAAGFDGVQLHGAHGYLINQFLSPAINQRTDEWGGDFKKRLRFLSEITQAVRAQVGQEYPVFIKFGMIDGIEGGLDLVSSANVVAHMAGFGLDAIEISGGIGSKKMTNVRKGIRRPEDEAYFLPLAQRARQSTSLPIALVGGLRSREVMEKILVKGDADFISLCRPLISEPDFPNQLRTGHKDKSRCIAASNCWAESTGVGIACKCPLEKVTAGQF